MNSLVGLVLFFSLTFGQSVYLRDVETLTFFPDRMTTGRRSSPIQQIQCENCPPGRRVINSIQCKNSGWDGRDVSWKCEALMSDAQWKMEKAEVSCEGYEHPNDPNVLQGSCGVEVRVARLAPQVAQQTAPQYQQQKETWLQTFLICLFMLCVALFVVLLVIWLYTCDATKTRVEHVHHHPSPPAVEEVFEEEVPRARVRRVVRPPATTVIYESPVPAPTYVHVSPPSASPPIIISSRPSYYSPIVPTAAAPSAPPPSPPPPERENVSTVHATTKRR